MNSIWIHGTVIISLVVLQSTVLNRIPVFGIVPDLAFIMLILTANRNGNPKASLSGFVTGTVVDLLSLSPLGFHAFIYTLIAHIYGAFKGKIFIDPLLMPVLLSLAAVILKWVLGTVLGLFFFSPQTIDIFSKSFLIEAGISILMAPFILGVMTLSKMVSLTEKTI
jgi:rod shape-determining protein MreD